MRDFERIYELSPFTKLVAEIRQAMDHQADVMKAERANIAALWERVSDNSASEMLGLISEELGLMNKSMAAIAANAEAARRVAVRERFENLKRDLDDSIAGGAIDSVDVARLEGAIHVLARNLER